MQHVLQVLTFEGALTQKLRSVKHKMARRVFPGRPSHKAKHEIFRYKYQEVNTSVANRSTRNLERNFQQFYEIFGASDDDNEFDGFPIGKFQQIYSSKCTPTNNINHVYKDNSKYASRRNHKDNSQSSEAGLSNTRSISSYLPDRMTNAIRKPALSPISTLRTKSNSCERNLLHSTKEENLKSKIGEQLNSFKVKRSIYPLRTAFNENDKRKNFTDKASLCASKHLKHSTKETARKAERERGRKEKQDNHVKKILQKRKILEEKRKENSKKYCKTIKVERSRKERDRYHIGKYGSSYSINEKDKMPSKVISRRCSSLENSCNSNKDDVRPLAPLVKRRRSFTLPSESARSSRKIIPQKRYCDEYELQSIVFKRINVDNEFSSHSCEKHPVLNTKNPTSTTPKPKSSNRTLPLTKRQKYKQWHKFYKWVPCIPSVIADKPLVVEGKRQWKPSPKFQTGFARYRNIGLSRFSLRLKNVKRKYSTATLKYENGTSKGRKSLRQNNLKKGNWKLIKESETSCDLKSAEFSLSYVQEGKTKIDYTVLENSQNTEARLSTSTEILSNIRKRNGAVKTANVSDSTETDCNITENLSDIGTDTIARDITAAVSDNIIGKVNSGNNSNFKQDKSNVINKTINFQINKPKSRPCIKHTRRIKFCYASRRQHRQSNQCNTEEDNSEINNDFARKISTEKPNSMNQQEELNIEKISVGKSQQNSEEIQQEQLNHSSGYDNFKQLNTSEQKEASEIEQESLVHEDSHLVNEDISSVESVETTNRAEKEISDEGSASEQSDDENNEKVANTISCTVCLQTKCHMQVKRHYGQFCCNTCSKFFASFLRRPQQYYCPKKGCCAVVSQCSSETGNLQEEYCKACWLKTCLDKFIVPVYTRKKIKNYIPKLLEEKSVVELSDVKDKSYNNTILILKETDKTHGTPLQNIFETAQQNEMDKSLDERDTIKGSSVNDDLSLLIDLDDCLFSDVEYVCSSTNDNDATTSESEVTSGKLHHNLRDRSNGFFPQEDAASSSTVSAEEEDNEPSHLESPKISNDVGKSSCNETRNATPMKFFRSCRRKRLTSTTHMASQKISKENTVPKSSKTPMKRIFTRLNGNRKAFKNCIPNSMKRSKETKKPPWSPRIKHVCRRASVVFGHPVAKFEKLSETDDFNLSALPREEKERILDHKTGSPDLDDLPLDELIRRASEKDGRDFVITPRVEKSENDTTRSQAMNVKRTKNVVTTHSHAVNVKRTKNIVATHSHTANVKKTKSIVTRGRTVNVKNTKFSYAGKRLKKPLRGVRPESVWSVPCLRTSAEFSV